MRKERLEKLGNIGILVGGGPAPGINGIITAATIGARKNDLTVYGIFDGYRWLVQGEKIDINDYVKKLRIRDVSRIHFDGGSYLRTSRTNPKFVIFSRQRLLSVVRWAIIMGYW